jgi:hypothetical protein
MFQDSRNDDAGRPRIRFAGAVLFLALATVLAAFPRSLPEVSAKDHGDDGSRG